VIEDLHKKYGNDLRVVYKQLVVHPKNAMASALAYCAAAKQGKEKELNNLLWEKGFKGKKMDASDVAPAGGENPQQVAGAEKAQGQPQKCWDTPEGCPHVVAFAQEAQLDLAKFKADMKGPCPGLVQKDGRELQQLGVGATPAFFINGRYLSGMQPIENFVALIDEELKKANAAIAAGTPQAQYYKQMVLDKGLKSLGGS
jgi:protein-disulfide isomerase